MAGIGDALASMFAGAAGEYAGNRATEIRDTDKARLAEARELKMMALQQKYQTSEREATQGFQSGESEKDRNFRTSEREAEQAFRTGEREASQAFQAGENAKSQAAQLERTKMKEGEGPNGKKLKGSPIHLKGDEMAGTKDRIVYNYEDGTNEVVNVDDMKGGENYAANQVRPKAMEFGQDVANVRRAEKADAEKAKGTKAEPGAADKSLYTPKQQSAISQVRAKYPDASDEEIVSALKQNPKTSALFN